MSALALEQYKNARTHTRNTLILKHIGTFRASEYRHSFDECISKHSERTIRKAEEDCHFVSLLPFGAGFV